MLWWQVSLVLCAYGFFKEYRPSEPFISPFLTGPWKNFTKPQVNEEIYPVGTYVYTVLLVVVFLLTDLLRYKPVIIVGGLSGLVTWTMLIVCTTIPEMQVLEIFYGLFMASEIAYYTYIYAQVSKEHYQRVTSHTRTAFLLGKAGAGLSSQLFVMFTSLDYLQLNYLTVAGIGIATLSAFFLPSVAQSVYFHRQASNTSKNSLSSFHVDNSEKVKGVEIEPLNKRSLAAAFKFLYDDFIYAFTKSYVVRWSIWWALATCGYLQVTSYAQILWQEIVDESDTGATLYHGFVEFGYSILGAAITFAIGYVHLEWKFFGELSLGLLTVIQGGCLLYSAFLEELYVAYAVYMVYGMLYQVAITIASSEVAKYIREDSYALVFGVNTFFAVLLQTVLTAIVINTLQCPIRLQFQIYGSFYLIVGIGFLLAAIWTFCHYKRIPKIQEDHEL